MKKNGFIICYIFILFYSNTTLSALQTNFILFENRKDYINGGEVIVSQVVSEHIKANYEETESALTHYPYVEAHTIVFDAKILAYANLFKFFDLFAGIGTSFLPLNMVYLDIFTEVNMKVNDGIHKEDHDGDLSLKDTVHGSRFLPILLMGFQVNIWKLRIPFQITQTIQKNNKMVKWGKHD